MSKKATQPAPEGLLELQGLRGGKWEGLSRDYDLEVMQLRFDYWKGRATFAEVRLMDLHTGQTIS